MCGSERKLLCVVRMPWLVPGLERHYKHYCTSLCNLNINLLVLNIQCCENVFIHYRFILFLPFVFTQVILSDIEICLMI